AAAQQFFEETLHTGQNCRAFLGGVNSLAQRSAAGHTMSEPGHELLHLARRSLPPLVFLHQHLEISTDHFVAVGFRRLVVNAGVRVLANLAEDPGIRRRSAADPPPVAAGLSSQGGGVSRRTNAAVTDHRIILRGLHRRDPFPTRVAAIALLTRARM